MPKSKLYQKFVERAPSYGFQQIGVYSLLHEGDYQTLDSEHFDYWLENRYHGEMNFMQRHSDLRRNPRLLESWVKSIIVVRMDYLNQDDDTSKANLNSSESAFIARYALGRDYHKLIRGRLERLSQDVISETEPFQYRPFADSAPILEKQIAASTSIGWQGKNTLIMNRNAGSWFFLGMLFTDLEIAADEAHLDHCGQCTSCIDICPTKAIIAPYVLDARLCIAYLTIEHKSSIDERLRPLIGNRVFGCDDCQIFCPWNKFAQQSKEDDFSPRNELDNTTLLRLFKWNEGEFLKKTEGSAIRRLGHERWLRNVAIALGNALHQTISLNEREEIRSALTQQCEHPSALVREHVLWALNRDFV